MSTHDGAPPGIVLVRPDGWIDAAGHGAPSSWLGVDLADAEILGVDERERFADWLEQPRDADYVWVEPFAAASGGTLMVVLLNALPVRRAPFPPRELLRRAVDTFVEQARSERVSLRVVVADDLPSSVAMDAEKLLWVLATLIGNALRMLKRTRHETEGTIELHAGFDAGERQLVIEVKDDGPGMTPDTAMRLFHPDPATGRTAGLALVLVRDVMTAHGGSIDVVTEVGKGATFTLRLPAPRPTP